MTDPGRVREIRQDFEACRIETRVHAKSFYFASHVLPQRKRLAAYAVYDFCRRADDSVDRAAMDDAGRHLDALRAELDAVYSPAGPANRRFLALHETVNSYRIPKEHFLDLLRGVEMDLTKKRYATFGELREYCYCVASVVGLIMTRIFGVSDERARDHAIDMGIAMQLTNILRDIGEDARMGRIYLPSDELGQFQVSEADLHEGRVTERFRMLMAFQIGRARSYYKRGEAGIPFLTDDGSRFCVRLMDGVYGRILNAIERNGYDVFSARAHVPTRTKLALAVRMAVPLGREGCRPTHATGNSRP